MFPPRIAEATFNDGCIFKPHRINKSFKFNILLASKVKSLVDQSLLFLILVIFSAVPEVLITSLFFSVVTLEIGSFPNIMLCFVCVLLFFCRNWVRCSGMLTVRWW